jgi:hypothetical protein
MLGPLGLAFVPELFRDSSGETRDSGLGTQETPGNKVSRSSKVI